MNERQQVISEIIKVLPDVTKTLNRVVAAHQAARLSPGRTITTAEMRCLIHLALYGAQTMGDLAAGMKMSRAAATGLIRPLAAMGYVRRWQDSRDRRVVRVALSKEAESVAERVLGGLRKEIEVALADVGEEDCRVFLMCLERLAGLEGTGDTGVSGDETN